MKRRISPIFSMGIIIIIVAIFSLVLALLEVDSNTTAIVNGNLETSIVVVKNLFTKEGFTDLLKNIMNSFVTIQPVVNLILAIAATGVLYTSGLLKHIFYPLRKLKPSLITFFTIFITVISTIIGEYSFVILLPLVAVMYKYLNKSSILGVVTVFLGATLGYGTGIFYNYNDYMLGLLTESAAVLEVAQSYQFDLYSTLYIMIASSVAITFLLTYLIEQNVSKKIKVSEPYTDEYITSKKAFIITIITFLVISAIILLMFTPVLGNILLDTTSLIPVTRIFGENSPFNLSFMFIYFIIASICSMVYGFISKNYESNLEFSFGYGKLFNNVGYLFILMFLSTILVYIIEWTNLGVVVSNVLLNFLSTLDITGLPLIIISFIIIVLMGFFMPGTVEKWTLISPIIIPLFVRGNLTPDFAQFVFKTADSVGKIITPAFIFFPIMLGFIQMNNTNQNKITLLGTFKLLFPVIISMVFFWLIILVVWYIAGLPLGFAGTTTF